MKIDIYKKNGISFIRTLEDISFYIDDKKYVVPAGFISDGASIPSIFWGFISPCIDARTLLPAVIHDYLYSVHIVDRLTADRIFLEYLMKNDFPCWKSYTCYYAVRIFGVFYF